ncbi:hypothetical protein J2W96_002539 [Variovorax guangxiensis]|nr:hypothetical protein [Variovorax guangxiensis]
MRSCARRLTASRRRWRVAVGSRRRGPFGEAGEFQPMEEPAAHRESRQRECARGPRRSRKRARRRAIEPQISAVLTVRLTDTMTAARSANPGPTSRRSRARDHGRAHKIATTSRTPGSAGLSVAATRTIASAVTVAGGHQAWRYQRGQRGRFMGRNCGSAQQNSLSNFAHSSPKPASVARRPHTRGAASRTTLDRRGGPRPARSPNTPSLRSSAR